MNAKRFRIGFVTSLMLVFLQGGLIYGQEEGQVIVISPRVGEVIDREERNRYQLFSASRDFHCAGIFQLPDSSYVAEITENTDGVKRIRTLPIDQRTLDLLREQIARPHQRPNETWQRSRGSLVRLETTNGCEFTGFLHEIRDDSIALSNGVEISGIAPQASTQATAAVGLNDITALCMTRNSNFVKGAAWGLLPITLGAALGAAADDEGEFINPGAIILGLGIMSGFTIGSIGGSIAALKGVDVDVLWDGKSEVQKRAILTQIRSGHYRSRPFFKVSPWVGVVSPPEGKAAAVVGGRARYYFTPRSGLELAYGRTRWFDRQDADSYTHYTLRRGRRRMECLSGGFFVSITRKRRVNPFFSWGWGRVATTTDGWEDKDARFAFTYYGGVEIPLGNSLSLEGRYGDIWALFQGHHPNFQLALSYGLNL
jgi:hypothetical protein